MGLVDRTSSERYEGHSSGERVHMGIFAISLPPHPRKLPYVRYDEQVVSRNRVYPCHPLGSEETTTPRIDTFRGKRCDFGKGIEYETPKYRKGDSRCVLSNVRYSLSLNLVDKTSVVFTLRKSRIQM